MADLTAGSGFDSPQPRFFTEDDILSVLDRVLPEEYLGPLKDPGPGYEIFQAWAKALERVSLAVGRTELSLLIIDSQGGSLAEADVEFFRTSDAAGAFTVKAGTACRTSATNRTFSLLGDVAFGPTDLVAAGRVRAVAPGAEYNVLGPATTADGTPLAGEIDSIVIPLLDPVFAEPTIQVRQTSAASGGAAAVLDQHGLDRNIPRTVGEPDSIYKGRIRQLPDTISPDALKRQLDALFLPIGLSYTILETWRNEYQVCYDAPDTVVVHPTLGTFDPTTFQMDPIPTSLFRGRLLDERDHMGGLVVVVPETGPWSERSMAFDDPGTVGPSSKFAVASTLAALSYTSGAPEPITTTMTPWAATLTCVLAGDGANAAFQHGGGSIVGLTVVVAFRHATAAVEVRDRQRWNGTVWVNDDGAVGVLVSSTAGGVLTTSIESAINSTSTLIQVTTPDPKTVAQAFVDASSIVYIMLAGGLTSNETARGWRAVSALDAPDQDGNPVLGQFVRVPFSDGYDLLHRNFYKNLSALVTAIKGGGTSSVIELEGQ